MSVRYYSNTYYNSNCNVEIPVLKSKQLGSVRLTYSAQGNCHKLPVDYTIQSANDYYAFGRSLRSFNNTGKYGHQGSEKEKELSDNDYYTHFRGLDDDIARWKQVDPKNNFSFSPYTSMNDNPVSFSDVLGDSIRKTTAFQNDAYWMKSYDTWMGTESGKQFVKDYGEGGKFEHISVVFDVISRGQLSETNKWAGAQTNTELVPVSNPKNAEELVKYNGAPNNSIPGSSSVAMGNSKDSYLRFTLQMVKGTGTAWPSHYAENVVTLIHEKQHMEVNLFTITKHNTMPNNGIAHDNMHNKNYTQERTNAFWSLKNLWSTDYMRLRHNYGGNPFLYVDEKANGFKR